MYNTLLQLWAVCYIYTYGLPFFLIDYLWSFYTFYDKVFGYYNSLIYPEYWDYYTDEEDNNDADKCITPKPTVEKIIRYEDKYVKDMKNLSKEWEFSEEALVFINKDAKIRYNNYLQTVEQQINALKQHNTSIDDEVSFDYLDENTEISDNLDDDLEEQTDKKVELKNTKKMNEDMILKFENDINSEEWIVNKNLECLEAAKSSYILVERLEKLNNSYVMEKTPVGNVIMTYKSSSSDSFIYYADSNIPYRYLEVVARKFVKMFNCRPIYIDIEEELELSQSKSKLEKEERELERLKELQREKDRDRESDSIRLNKKQVFTKFKSYNKDAGTKSTMHAPPKNSIPNKKVTKTEDVYVKENANRYTYKGKISNFNFLQKVDRSAFDKKLGMSFSDFKNTSHYKNALHP
jgi:hypothetical protein